MNEGKIELADTANLSLVHYNRAADLVFIRPADGLLPCAVNRAHALNMAAWIVALVDPEGKDFPRLLDAVKKV